MWLDTQSAQTQTKRPRSRSKMAKTEQGKHMSPILHILHAKPIDIKCVQKRLIGGCWVDVLDQTEINRITKELEILDFFLGDLKKINQYQKPTSYFRNRILELRKRGLIERKTGNQYITTEAGWEYMCRYKANATQRESAELGNCMPIVRHKCA